MAQLNLYIGDKLMERIKKTAKAEGLSLSKWTQKRLERSLDTEWPEGYFELFGSLKDADDFERPEQPDPSLDVPREPF